MIGEKFTCSHCGGTFKKGRSDEEALADMQVRHNFEIPEEECMIICEDCFQRYTQWLSTSNIMHIFDYFVHKYRNAESG